MSGITETREKQPYLTEKYQSKYRDCIPVIQVALWAIVATGITLALLSRFGSLEHTFLYVGISISTISTLVAIGILLTKKNYLSKALDDVQTIEELQEIVETIQTSDWNCSLKGCLTGFGNCVGANLDFIITSTKLKGTISDSKLQSVINRLLQQATNNCMRPLDEGKRLAFEQLCDLANKKCDKHTTYNNFEVPEKYLK